MLRVSSGFCFVVRICVNMGVDNSRPADNVYMRKQSRTCIVTCENYYEKDGKYFLCFDHAKIDMGAKLYN